MGQKAEYVQDRPGFMPLHSSYVRDLGQGNNIVPTWWGRCADEMRQYLSRA